MRPNASVRGKLAKQEPGPRRNRIALMTMGSLSLISLGLVVASRSTSEEFAEGLLNMINWPMIFLSGIWFSLEGAPRRHPKYYR